MTIEAMMHYEAALMAAFPHGGVGKVFEHWSKARQAIVLAEKQKPVAWLSRKYVDNFPASGYETAQPTDYGAFPVYTAPQPQREWVGLTPYQFDQIEQLFGHTVPNDFVLADIVCTVESKLKENNQ